MASEPLEVGDYVRWDKSDAQARKWSSDYGDEMMRVNRAYISHVGPVVNLVRVNDGSSVGSKEPGDFFHHRFVKEVFLSAASQANRKESDGNTKACEG